MYKDHYNNGTHPLKIFNHYSFVFFQKLVPEFIIIKGIFLEVILFIVVQSESEINFHK